jgi:hypothetical protein
MDPDPFQESVRHLSTLGFTALEAAVYTFLVESSRPSRTDYLSGFRWEPARVHGEPVDCVYALTATTQRQ